MAEPETTGRVLGVWQAAGIAVGMVIGAGIFSTAPLVAQNLSSETSILAAWALGGVFAIIGALCYAELTSAFPAKGGDYRFLGEAFGSTVAFLFAWSRFSVIFTASAAMLAFVGADYLAQLFPMGNGAKAAVAATAIVALTALNLKGVKTGTKAQIGLVAMDVIALLSLGVAALSLTFMDIPPQQVDNSVASAGGLGAAMVFVMLAYGGFNDAATLSSEVRRPADMTRALIGGMSMVTALYMLANWAYLRGLGAGGLAGSEAPAAALMKIAFGPIGEAVIVIGVVSATLAILNALIIVGGRTLYAAAEDEPALGKIAQWDSARGVPRVAIFIQTGVALILVGWGAFSGRGFAQMVDYLSPVYWLFLMLAGLAVIVLRIRKPDVPRPYKVPLFPLLPLVFTLGSAFVLSSSIDYVGLKGCLISFGVLAFGLLARAGWRFALGSPKSEMG
jgi:basic amino acid/polyamine antiporter, APA family